MRKLMVRGGAVLVAATLGACDMTPPPETAKTNFDPYTSNVGPSLQWTPGDARGDGPLVSKAAPPAAPPAVGR